MGAASSIFDCALNPLNPLPEEAGSEPKAPLALEEAVPLRESLLWKLQRAFYEVKGVSAWSEGIVPNFLTTNSFVARAYARLTLGLLRDVFTPGVGIAAPRQTEPLYIVELAAGHGKLAYLIVETLLRYRSFFPKNDVPGGVPFRYVITDAFAPTVRAWRAMPVFREFFDMGVLDVAVYDAERDVDIKLEISGTVISPSSPLSHPPLIIANYAFDSLRTDAFRVSHGVLEQCRVTLTSSLPRPLNVEPSLVASAAPPAAVTAAAPAPDGSVGVTIPSPGAVANDVPPPDAPLAATEADASLLSKVAASFSYTPITQPSTATAAAAPGSSCAVYGEPILDGLLAAYASHPLLREAATLLIPLGALHAVRSLAELCPAGLVLLVGDKGHTRLSDLVGHR